jgi:8-oxo-dGTP pyrophosphatase MutT (NUDIX family)
VEDRPLGPAEAPNHGSPSVPRLAASVVLLRRGGKHAERSLEVLLLQRTQDARFMPGLWVFPGGALDPGDGEGEDGHRACAIRELEEEASIQLAPDEELVPFCRWITPESIATRFDARFFLALAPAHTPPKPDGLEMTAAAWYAPADALAAHAAGDLPIAFPTLTQLQMLKPFRTSEEALAAHRGRPMEATLPKVIGEGEERHIALPGDPDYPRDGTSEPS